jgi:hypothetical protein
MTPRFVVTGDICVVRLLSNQNGTSVGLILHGEKQMEEFASEAISALETMLKSKNGGNGVKFDIYATAQKTKKECYK